MTPNRPRRIILLVALAVVLVGGLVVGFLVLDRAAKDVARDYVRERIIEVLGLDPEAEVNVHLEGSILLQAIRGQLDVVDVEVPELAFGTLVGSATVHAEAVPLDQNAPVGVLRIVFSVAESDLTAIAANLSGLELDTIELEDPEIVVTTSFRIFALTLPVGMGLEPSAVDGALAFDPTSVRVGDITYSAEELLNDPILGLLAQTLLRQQSLCIAENLPVALVATDVHVDGSHLVLEITGDGAALGGPELRTMGSCPV